MKEIKCCQCLENVRRKGQRYCLKCHAANMRYWRILHPMTLLQQQKSNCRSYAHVYLKRGKLQKQSCNQCGSIDSEMHHSDYQKPLFVTWLCRSCHLSLHRGTTSN